MMVRGVTLAWALALAASDTSAQDAEQAVVPAPFAPFEHLIGGWKGAARPSDNPIKGWVEEHDWAWKLAKGQPVGMTLAVAGKEGSAIAKADLTYDDATSTYRLDGTDPKGRPVHFAGALKDGRLLVLDRKGATPRGQERLTIRVLPDNLIRYVMWLDVKEAGAPAFEKALDVGMTKRGEAFAAGGAAENLPKCIITGGAATLSVSYKGQSFPVCCSGCQEEFKDDPERYIKKAALRASKAPKGTKPVKSAGLRKDDGAFDGLTDPAPRKARPLPRPSTSKSDKGEARPADDGDKGKDKDKGSPKPPGKEATARAASLLRLGQALEKSGKKAGALNYYRDVVKKYPDTPSARTATERIKALGGK